MKRVLKSSAVYVVVAVVVLLLVTKAFSSGQTREKFGTTRFVELVEGRRGQGSQALRPRPRHQG